MKYVKMLGLLAVAAAALMAFAGSASATTLTSPANEELKNSAKIKGVAEAPHTKLDGTIVLTCEESVVEGEITEQHVVKGTITNLTFSKCGNNTITVVPDVKTKDYGTLEVNSKTEAFSTGAEVTALTHNILGTVHCIYKTNNTKVGTLTDTSQTGTNGTLDIGSAGIPQVATDGACKNDAVWTGNYVITAPGSSKPGVLYVDHTP